MFHQGLLWHQGTAAWTQILSNGGAIYSYSWFQLLVSQITLVTWAGVVRRAVIRSLFTQKSLLSVFNKKAMLSGYTGFLLCLGSLGDSVSQPLRSGKPSSWVKVVLLINSGVLIRRGMVVLWLDWGYWLWWPWNHPSFPSASGWASYGGVVLVKCLSRQSVCLCSLSSQFCLFRVCFHISSCPHSSH